MRFVPTAWLLLAVAGCGVETDDRPVSFEYITTAILRPSCGGASCHSTQNQRAGYILDEPGPAYETLSEKLVPCTDGPGSCDLTDRDLAPIFYLMITKPPNGKDRMPLDAPLPQADIDLIGRWLVAGAEQN
jgi:hypothetical protein